MERIIPEVPAADKRIKLLIDSDVANEIDDLYAITMAVGFPERFDIKGFVTTHFATAGGPDSTQKSYDLLMKLFSKMGIEGKFKATKGSHPMQYPGTPTQSEGVDFIISCARACSAQDPLWVVGLGAATNLACAILKAPDITDKVRYVFHSRSEQTWPERSCQFNVMGDIIAAKTLLESNVPLVWLDTGTHICATYETTKEKLAPMGELGEFLHNVRDLKENFKNEYKGFFDMADIVFLLDPSVCKSEVVSAPGMRRDMYFIHNNQYGIMLRVYDVDVQSSWRLFYEAMENMTTQK